MPEIQKLLKQVKAKMLKRGDRTKLAQRLGVAPAQISDWLSGKYQPNYENTIRLQKWLAESK